MVRVLFILYVVYAISYSQVPPIRFSQSRTMGKAAKKFCGCIKKVRKTLKARKGSSKESGAIAVCTTRLLWPHGKTLRKVRCDKVPRLLTQKRRNH